ncbi:MAG: carboxypeptidase regulatory-like domain-containing protein [Deltaproteobacteria bacterium]|nr:carboxypeptidase regulatory-like domain-containing protein [Deltaproteobacteria bacterium]
MTIAGLALAVFLLPHPLSSQQTVALDNNDIGGVVTSAKGPEAGVWVIAETNDLPTRFARMVVTDDQGRYVLPDLPKASYDIWVRGYGLVDSPKVKAAPGRHLNLRAVLAPNDAAAAKYYPAIHWYSMLKIPEASEFGGKGAVPVKITQNAWLNSMKSNGCVGCHQMGQLSTRTFPKDIPHPINIENSQEAWFRRIQSGQSGESMFNTLMKDLGGAPIKYFADWTDRVAKGELPDSKPARPQGVERNIVVTTWDWSSEKKYLHDLIASDRRYPTVNAYGPLYGSPEYSTDLMPVLDPKKHTATHISTPVRPGTPEALGPGHAASDKLLQPSPYWGAEKLWDTRSNNHNAMFDRKGRVWFAAAFRDAPAPDFCKKGSSHPSAKVFPVERNNRQLTMLDPKTGQYTFVDTCFGSHHLQFGYDANDTLWTSGAGQVVGWVNTKMFDETGDIARSQGWTPMILDTNGNGKRDEYVEPNQPVDPAKDKRIVAGFYAVMPNPVDGSVWGTFRSFPGAVVRVAPGSNPSETALTEIYNVPLPGFGPRGGDIDKQGVIWVSLSSGHLASFDRRKCKGPLNGPKATGDHCPEGWAFHKYPGPGFKGLGDNSAESSYYTWVDQHNTFGLGNDVPMSTGNLNDGLIAFKDGKMMVLRVPYPLGFYAKGFDGRIDDPNAGWKGRGLWSASGDRAPWLNERGKGAKPMAVQFQLRPDPLAK